MLAAVLSTIVVSICAILELPEVWWLLALVSPATAVAVIRRDARCRAEAALLEKVRLFRAGLSMPVRQRVLVFVDSVGLAELEALRYAKALRSDRLTAVHFVIDEAHAARLQVRWQHFGNGIELRMIDCEDRNLGRAAHDLVAQAKRDYPDSAVTALLPRRMYSPLAGRLFHDRTADSIARTVSRIPDASAQILVYDVKSRVEQAIRAADRGLPGHSSDASEKPQATTPVK
jgi:hypothetical protein